MQYALRFKFASTYNFPGPFGVISLPVTFFMETIQLTASRLPK